MVLDKCVVFGRIRENMSAENPEIWVVILAVRLCQNQRGLLGARMYSGGNEGLISLPVGKVRFGESMKETLRRIGRDDFGIKFGAIKYFTHQEVIDEKSGRHMLMMIHECQWLAGDLRVRLENKEYDAAAWYGPEEMFAMLGQGKLTPFATAVMKDVFAYVDDMIHRAVEEAGGGVSDEAQGN